MTKLLQNKPIIKFLGIALSILLIVALVPQINIAYGSKDDVLADTGTEESVEDTERSRKAPKVRKMLKVKRRVVLSDENVLDGADSRWGRAACRRRGRDHGDGAPRGESRRQAPKLPRRRLPRRWPATHRIPLKAT